MGLIWFCLVAIMMVGYVILDGFDLGVGILHIFVARNEKERQLVLRSIGPVWDGNEVWLIASGGTLYFAFPLLYASAFSGFYLALMIVLWLLIMRGMSIELRMHLQAGVWRAFFDGLFFLSSLLLTIFYGAALANVMRGVPLETDEYFFLPLWTDFRVGPHPGILDWYTAVGGVVALVALTVHGAFYLALKTENGLQARSRGVAGFFAPVLFGLTMVSLFASVFARPDTLSNYRAHPVGMLVPVAVLLALTGMVVSARKSNDRNGFICSCCYLAFMLGGAAVALYPRLLPSSSDASRDITIQNALSGSHALQVGLIWWLIGMSLALGYFFIIYRMFKGKVSLESGGYGH